VRRARLARVLMVLAAAVVILAGCDATPGRTDQQFSGPPYTLRVLASPELDDLQGVLDDAAKVTGVTVKLTPSTALTIARDIADGKTDKDYDAAWLASNRYLSVYPGAQAKVEQSTLTMSSPVVLGVRTSVADQLGWRDDTPVSWSDIARSATAHRFTFGMSDPRSSNSGLSALVGVATAAAGDGAALQPPQVTRAAPRLREFFDAQTLKSGSSKELANTYASRQGRSVDALVEYESELITLNRTGSLQEPLRLIYPSDGVATADYTLNSLVSAPKAAKDAYARLSGYLRTDDVQRRIMRETHRRPITPQLLAQADFGVHQSFELPFPDRLDVVNDLVAAYYGTLRKPARTVYVLDTSGSMAEDGRLDALKRALTDLTRAGSGPGASFQTREQVTFVPFGSTVGTPSTFDVPATDPQAVLDRIRAYVQNLPAVGDTALYDALIEAYRTIARQTAQDPDRITTIVLLTDGEWNKGSNADAFDAFYRTLGPDVAAIPVFPIRYGDNSNAAMDHLATLTGGQVFDGRALPLATIFPLIRGSQ
jgi:Ca-activated chloride channel homolog